MGRPLAEARAILATYGEAELSVWPEWVGTIPTFDTRVAVSTTEPADSTTAQPSAEPSP
jgi:hypothetical protein